MTIISIVILLLFVSITLKELKHIKSLIVPTRKSLPEIITILFSIIISSITYLYANSPIHYINCILGTFMFICMWLKKGIIPQGFISMSRGQELIAWDKIEKVNVLRSKDIKVALFGGFMERTFNFKNDDYDKVIDILKEKLSYNADIQII